MSSLIFHTEKDQVLVATDTLATSPDGRPFKFTTKAFIVPHLNMIVAGTGNGPFPNRWAIRLNETYILRGIDHLNEHASRDLAALWRGHKQEFSLPTSSTVTIYHFGFSENTGSIHSFVYRSPDFRSEQLTGYGIGVKPECTVPENYELPSDIRTMMNDQRRREALRPLHERVFIGGEIQIHRLSRSGFHVYTLDRFDDYQEDENAIHANLRKGFPKESGMI
jgi:hypothetical protein